MLHANLQWPEVADEPLWNHSLQYAVYLHDTNHEDSEMSPIDI